MKHTIYPKQLNHTPLEITHELRHRKPPTNHYGRLFLSMLIASVLMTSVIFSILKEKVNNVYAEHKSDSLTNTLLALIGNPSFIKPRSLAEAVENTLIGAEGNYGVSVKNLKTGEEYSYNGHRQFQPASVYKIWIMATTMNQLQSRKLYASQLLSQPVPVLNAKFAIATDAAEQKEGIVTHTIDDALEQMITISDNYSALLLSDAVTLASASAYMSDHGLRESRLGIPPMTTAADTALFFEKLYNGELADRLYTQKMIALLKRQKINDSLPKYLPRNVEVAHKTGAMDTVANDAGIVYGEKNDYVIAVLSETTDPAEAKDMIGKVSKAVYMYFEE